MRRTLPFASIELWPTNRPDSGDDDRDVIGQASGHDRARGHLLHRRFAKVWADSSERQICVDSSCENHSRNTFRRWDDDR